MPYDKDVKNCPFCGEKVDENAEKCPFCERIFRMGISPQKMQSDRKRVGYIAAASVIFLAALCLILFMFSGNKKESSELSSDKIKTPPLSKILQKEPIQLNIEPDAQSDIISPEKNIEPQKNIADKSEAPLKKSSSTEEKTIEKPEKPSEKPLPKPKIDNSDFYTLG